MSIKNTSKPLPDKRNQLSKEEQNAYSSLSAADPADPADGVAPPSTHLILVLHGNQLAAWQASPLGAKPKALRIKDDPRAAVRDARTLETARADIAERLRGDGINVAYTHWLADANGRQWCADCMAKTDNAGNGGNTGNPTWQILAWEWLAERFGFGDASPWEAAEPLVNQVLPWLVTADDAAQRQHLQQARESEHRSETEQLAAQRNALVQANERLRAENAALQQVDVERLVSFLPALFPRVFTVLGPTDLAQLCGRVEPLSIPNPYPEPSEETLRTLQRGFRALPQQLQQQIVRFVARLPQRHKLQPRAEMRELVQTLEEN